MNLCTAVTILRLAMNLCTTRTVFLHVNVSRLIVYGSLDFLRQYILNHAPTTFLVLIGPCIQLQFIKVARYF